MMKAENSFGQLLKQWRSQRNFSQLDLSMASDVSQRHISFLESGRAKPSREMVLKLSTVLDIPLRQRNKILTAAGFAPIYSEFDLTSPEVAPIRRALEFTLRQQEPYPALVMDRYWNQIMMNKGAENLLGWLLEDKQAPAEVGPNLIKLMLHPQGIKAHVLNWDAIATHLIRRVHREALAEGQDEQSQQLFDTLLTYPDVESLWQAPVQDNWQLPLLSTIFSKSNSSSSASKPEPSKSESLKKDSKLDSKSEQHLSFFTTLTTLGTPQDITLQELRLECLFPADKATEKHFHALFD